MTHQFSLKVTLIYRRRRERVARPSHAPPFPHITRSVWLQLVVRSTISQARSYEHFRPYVNACVR